MLSLFKTTEDMQQSENLLQKCSAIQGWKVLQALL